MSYGKDGSTGAVIRTSEVADPRDELELRIRKLGGNDAIVASARDTFGRGLVDLSRLTDDQLAAQIEAIMAGSDDAFALADAQQVAEARTDPALWQEAQQVVQGNVPSVIRWVGTNAGRAMVAHEAELQRALDAGTEPRKTVVTFCANVHGQQVA